MKIFVSFFTSIILSLTSMCQAHDSNNYINLTAGRIIYGTGDFFGYSANIEYSKFLNHKKNSAKKIALGFELSFENGSTHPTIINPTLQEFLFGHTYRTATNIVLTPKLTYHPINKTFLKGLNISGGISFGYSSQAREFQATRTYDSVSQTYFRRSYLEFNNGSITGFRITTGYEWLFKKILIGARLDFDSYTNGDINTFYGLKTGFRF